jgi:hypothetical protein
LSAPPGVGTRPTGPHHQRQPPPSGAGALLHGDGSAWSAVSSGAAVDLSGIWGSGPGETWVVGYGGAVLRRGP